MADNQERNDEPILASADEGFMPIDEILEAATLQAAKVRNVDLTDLLDDLKDAAPAPVLVVDDDRQVRSLICRQLVRKGYRTTGVANSAEAWVYMRTTLPHAVITDVNLPGVDGLEFLRQVMQRYPDTVVLVITGAPDMEMAIKALRAGATDLLVKPLEFGELVKSLERGLERRKSRLDMRRYQLNLEQIISERTRHLLNSFDELQKRNRQLTLAYRDTIIRLGRASEWRDDETGFHIQRIGMFSAEVARAMNLSRDDVNLIAEASPMHDIGKIGVPDKILLKPGSLDPTEYEIMKSHTLIGGQVLSGSNAPILRASEDIAVGHHEWYNGDGYPFGIKEKEIPLYARIVTVVDVYDALIHERIYKPAMELDEALDMMAGKRGTQFDPEVFEAFLQVVEELVTIERNMESRMDRRLAYGVQVGLLNMMKKMKEGTSESALYHHTPRTGYPLQEDEFPAHEEEE